jgi:hypothetical protein
MNFNGFNKHNELRDKHAFLSASKYHWLNYDIQKLIDTYMNAVAAARGTELHDWACRTIKLRKKQVSNKDTINMYINDAITYGMTPEQVLFYSRNCFGTADAISFRKNLLRIHDLKTGVTPASMEQLKIYAALFCLEYFIKPADISFELRIYQLNEVSVEKPEPAEIEQIMQTIMTFDKEIEKIRAEEEG